MAKQMTRLQEMDLDRIFDESYGAVGREEVRDFINDLLNDTTPQ